MFIYLKSNVVLYNKNNIESTKIIFYKIAQIKMVDK